MATGGELKTHALKGSFKNNMKRTKIFRSSNGFDELEKQINSWLETKEIEVVNIAMADNKDYVSAIVLYEVEGEYLER
jgi:phosphopantetheinyl transferase (holo-ACP synthase)